MKTVNEGYEEVISWWENVCSFGSFIHLLQQIVRTGLYEWSWNEAIEILLVHNHFFLLIPHQLPRMNEAEIKDKIHSPTACY